MIYAERVRLRRIERSDLPQFVAWLNDPEVREGLALWQPIGLPQEEQWFEATLRQEPALQPFAIEARLGGRRAGRGGSWRLLGVLAFHAIDWKNRSGELGIFIGEKRLWGKGYGTEAFRALVRFGFRELNLNRVYLRVYEENARAIRSYEKIGFKIEGRLRQDRFHDGRYSDTLVMGLLREELTE